MKISKEKQLSGAAVLNKIKVFGIQTLLFYTVLNKDS
jgi:hypothetical protein